MTVFLCVYFGAAAATAAAVFVLSLLEEKHRFCRGILLAVYIAAIFGVLFATGCLEEQYGWHRLYSTLTAGAVLLCIYLADLAGGKLRGKKS